MAAAAPWGAPTVDATALFGAGPPAREQLRWEPPAPAQTTREPNEGKSHAVFPQWLASLSDNTHHIANVSNECLVPIRTQLKEATSLEQILHIRKQPKAEEMELVEFSRLAFGALLKNQAPYGDVFGFLKDMNVNAPEAKNFATFLTHQPNHELDRGEYREFVQTLRQSITLGLVLPDELPVIIDAVRHISSMASNVHSEVRSKRLCRAYSKIWDGLSTCRIAPINPEILHLLLSKVLELENRRQGVVALKLELYMHASPLENGQCSGAADVGQYLACWARRVRYPDSKTTPVLDRSRFMDILNSLDAHGSNKQIKWITSATKTLIDQEPSPSESRSAWRNTLNFWLLCLRKTTWFAEIFNHSYVNTQHLEERYKHYVHKDWFGIYIALAKSVSPGDLASFFSSFEPRELSWLLLRFWVPYYIRESVEKAQTIYFLRPRRIYREISKKKVWRNFSYSPWSPEPWEGYRHLANMIIAFARSNLNYQTPMAHILELCRKLYGGVGLLRACRHLRKAKILPDRKVVAKGIQQSATKDPTLALKLYECRSIWISSRPEMLLGIINAGVRSDVVFRILKAKDPTNTIPIQKRDHPKNCIHDLRNTLVHMAADAFSRYENRSSQITFRYVYLCYRYLVDRHSPINPLMGRALVRAGVMRPLQRMERVSTARFEWILQHIRRLEGDEVADELDAAVFQWRERVWFSYRRKKERTLRRQKLQMRKFDIDQPMPRRRSGVRLAPLPGGPFWTKVGERHRSKAKISTRWKRGGLRAQSLNRAPNGRAEKVLMKYVDSPADSERKAAEPVSK